MEIHFHESESECENIDFCLHGWKETEACISMKNPLIHTTQMGLVSTDLIEDGYRIFIHETNGDTYELRLGDCDRTDKEIRRAHNLFKMWQANAFAKR